MGLDEAIARATDTADNLSTGEVQQLLLELAELAGFPPQQVVGPWLRVRWYQWEDTLRSRGRVLALSLWPELREDEIRWSVTGEILDAPTLDREEHLELEYVGDPVSGGSLPYAWNLRVNGVSHQDWHQDFMSSIVDWNLFQWEVGHTLARMPVEFSALPAEWFDGTFTALDRHIETWWVRASRTGLDLRQDLLVPPEIDPTGASTDRVWYHFTPEQAFGTDRRISQLLMAQLSPTFPIHAIAVVGGAREEPFSGFLTPSSAHYVDPDEEASEESRLTITTQPADPRHELEAMASWSAHGYFDRAWDGAETFDRLAASGWSLQPTAPSLPAASDDAGCGKPQAS